jgi:hypothetical protein
VQGTWSFVYIAPNGCTDTLNYVIGVVGNPMPVINMGSNPICLNGSVQLCPSIWGWSNYQWYKNGVAIAAPTGTSACITLQASDVGSYQVQATNGSACWSQLSNPIVVTYNPGCAVTAFQANTNTQYLSVDSGNVINGNAQLQPQGGVAPYNYKASLANGTASSSSKKGGTITVNSTSGAFIYATPIGFVGLDTFYITVCDATTPIPNCATQMFVINVYSLSVSVTSGGGGGIESKSLGNIISQRLYGNAIHNRSQDIPKPTQAFIKSPIALNGPSDLRLVDLVPITVAGTNKALISTPTDLVNFTNAVEVLSVDYSNNNLTKAVTFGTRTLGDVYNHTKPICDRLKGAELLEVKTLNINGYNIMAFKVRQRTGEIEYAMNLNAGVAKNRSTISLQSNWFTNSYVPDETLFNFQLWAVSYNMVSNLAKDIITKLQQQGTVNSVTASDLPTAYVEKGNRTNTSVNLTIKNNTNYTLGYFELKEKQNEGSIETTRQIPFIATANGITQVQLPVQDFYEASIYMYLNNKLVDLVYMADGAWSLDYNKNNTTISQFNIQNEINPVVHVDEYRLFRNVQLVANTKDYVSVYKTINGGGIEKDLLAYKTLEFDATITGVNSIKVTIVKKGVVSWNNQYSYTIKPNATGNYALSLADFANANGNKGLIVNDVLAVNFALQTASSINNNISATINKARFTKVSTSNAAPVAKALSIYPNPTNNQFNAKFVSEVEESLILRVIDAGSGKTIKTVFVNAKKGVNTVLVNLGNVVVSSNLLTVTLDGDNGGYPAQKIMLQRK